MKKFLLIAALAVGAWLTWSEDRQQGAPFAPAEQAARPSPGTFAAPQSGQQLRGSGRVTRLLPDDNDGSRHQRFILEVDRGRTLLIAHNIDLAPRIDGLKVGDTVSFYGEYEPNDRGGVVHWTHHDPNGRHVGGWLEHGGRRYQ